MMFVPHRTPRVDDAIPMSHTGDVVAIDGRRLDLSDDESVERLRLILHHAIRPGVRTMRLHLREAGDSGTSVLAVLVAAAGQARECETELHILASPQLRELARICRLDEILAIEVSPVVPGR